MTRDGSVVDFSRVHFFVSIKWKKGGGYAVLDITIATAAGTTQHQRGVYFHGLAQIKLMFPSPPRISVTLCPTSDPSAANGKKMEQMLATS